MKDISLGKKRIMLFLVEHQKTNYYLSRGNVGKSSFTETKFLFLKILFDTEKTLKVESVLYRFLDDHAAYFSGYFGLLLKKYKKRLIYSENFQFSKSQL